MREPAKILYLNHAAHVGGAEIALLNLLTMLDRDAYTPVVFAPAGELADRLRQLQLRCELIPVLDGLNRYTLPHFLRALPRLTVRIAREKPALLHANTNFTAAYAGVISKLTRIPSVGHIRDIEPLGRMGRWAVRQNTKLIAISEAVKQYLRAERIPAPQLVRVYDGVDLGQYRPHKVGSDLVKWGPLDEKHDVIVGIIGQIGARKGHRYLLEAAWMLTQTHPHVRFWIVGKEPVQRQRAYTEELEEYIRNYHLQRYVKFWGFRPEITELLAKIDILALPSLQEPFGKIVIEAMAMAKPVVAANVGGVPEIVVDGETGLLVPPADADAFRQALEQLIPNRAKREQMGRAGRQRVERLFTLEQNVRATEQVYADILTKKFRKYSA